MEDYISLGFLILILSIQVIAVGSGLSDGIRKLLVYSCPCWSS